MKNNLIVFKATVLLITLYGFLELISNFILSFFISQQGPFDVFGTSPGFGLFNTMSFLIKSIVPLLILLAAFIIWKRGRSGYLVCIMMGILSIFTAIDGLRYLIQQIPYFNSDLYYITANISNMHGIIRGTDISINSLFAVRILVIKSYLKVVIELIAPFLFFLLITSNKYLFK